MLSFFSHCKKTVEFYLSEKGESPIDDFLLSCNKVQRNKITRQIKYLLEYGLSSAIPNLKKIINTPFWELRILGKDNIRILLVTIINDKITILHIFFKKKQKTPVKDLNIAWKRYKDLLA